MMQYVALFVDICLLRRGPQHLPTSTTLLGLTLAMYFAAALLAFTTQGTASTAGAPAPGGAAAATCGLGAPPLTTSGAWLSERGTFSGESSAGSSCNKGVEH